MYREIDFFNSLNGALIDKHTEESLEHKFNYTLIGTVKLHLLTMHLFEFARRETDSVPTFEIKDQMVEFATFTMEINSVVSNEWLARLKKNLDGIYEAGWKDVD
jgi:hypothetical protein